MWVCVWSSRKKTTVAAVITTPASFPSSIVCERQQQNTHTHICFNVLLYARRALLLTVQPFFMPPGVFNKNCVAVRTRPEFVRHCAAAKLSTECTSSFDYVHRNTIENITQCPGIFRIHGLKFLRRHHKRPRWLCCCECSLSLSCRPDGTAHITWTTRCELNDDIKSILIAAAGHSEHVLLQRRRRCQ